MNRKFISGRNAGVVRLASRQSQTSIPVRTQVGRQPRPVPSQNNGQHPLSSPIVANPKALPYIRSPVPVAAPSRTVSSVEKHVLAIRKARGLAAPVSSTTLRSLPPTPPSTQTFPILCLRPTTSKKKKSVRFFDGIKPDKERVPLPDINTFNITRTHGCAECWRLASVARLPTSTAEWRLTVRCLECSESPDMAELVRTKMISEDELEEFKEGEGCG
ncbi:hypothetical protein BJ878DRAFT_479289 [Calycina marina]|uniref:Uncharacterized protein n=1 Tax=Calycina marina TaxID=1763456 RepID=A0A9P8CG11_9HELO|nr:hypothetical protein BJ878DRAFT_479289 [Calycina marina]